MRTATPRTALNQSLADAQAVHRGTNTDTGRHQLSPGLCRFPSKATCSRPLESIPKTTPSRVKASRMATMVARVVSRLPSKRTTVARLTPAALARSPVPQSRTALPALHIVGEINSSITRQRPSFSHLRLDSARGIMAHTSGVMPNLPTGNKHRSALLQIDSSRNIPGLAVLGSGAAAGLRHLGERRAFAGS